MSYWNYRVVHHDPDGGFDIHEIYYDEDGTITEWSVDAVHPQGDTLAELKEDAEVYVRAILAPSLTESELP